MNIENPRENSFKSSPGQGREKGPGRSVPANYPPRELECLRRILVLVRFRPQPPSPAEAAAGPQFHGVELDFCIA